MKISRYHIICSWILLTCFVAGQYMVNAHQHKSGVGISTAINNDHTSAKQILKEKCALCDVMHHTSMVISNQVQYNPTVVVRHIYKTFEYNFTSIQLILSGGRAPPYKVYSI